MCSKKWLSAVPLALAWPGFGAFRDGFTGRAAIFLHLRHRLWNAYFQVLTSFTKMVPGWIRWMVLDGFSSESLSCSRTKFPTGILQRWAQLGVGLSSRLDLNIHLHALLAHLKTGQVSDVFML